MMPQRSTSELERRNTELTALYQVSLAISQVTDLDELLFRVLDTVTSLEYFNVLKKAGVLLVEEDRMDLVAYLGVGHTPEFLESHRGMAVGECLCGLAAQTGEIITSMDCVTDFRHTIRYPGMQPHGHIILPLSALGKVLGVMYLYLPASVSVDQRTLEVLRSVGDQLGVAIANAKGRAEIEAKATELANANQKLKETMAELEDSNAELEQFAYVASHDLQEPLRTVSSYLQLLERRYKESLEQDGRDFIDFAVDGSLRMQDMINDLLTFSRVETRGRPFEKTSMEAAFTRALSNLGAAARECGAQITHDPLPEILADSHQITQLLQNLMGNAIKFRREKEPPRIHVSAVRADEEWVFSVKDNGIGIDPKYFDRVFVIFQRLHTRRQYGGTGMGLAICKRIVERHGGRIWVKSEPDQGSTFYFTIPYSLPA